MEYTYEKPLGKRILNLIVLIILYNLVTLLYNIPDSLIPWADTPGMEVCRDLAYYGAAVVLILIFLKLVKCRPGMLDALTGKMSGNRGKIALIGLAAGAFLCLLLFMISFLSPEAGFDGRASGLGLVLLAFPAVLFQVLAEELGLRVFYYQSFRRTFKNPWAAIILTSLMFGYNHMSFDPLYFMNFTLAGLVFALMVYELDSPWCAIAYHFGWNYMGLLTGQYYESVYLCRQILTESEGMDFGLTGILPQILLNFLLVVVLLWMGKKNKKTKDRKEF